MTMILLIVPIAERGRTYRVAKAITAGMPMNTSDECSRCLSTSRRYEMPPAMSAKITAASSRLAFRSEDVSFMLASRAEYRGAPAGASRHRAVRGRGAEAAGAGEVDTA